MSSDNQARPPANTDSPPPLPSPSPTTISSSKELNVHLGTGPQYNVRADAGSTVYLVTRQGTSCPSPLPTSIRWLQRQPRDPSSNFFGRERELQQLHELLDGEQHQLATRVAIEGFGGLGKTELALQYVASHPGAFPGGVVWLDANLDLTTEWGVHVARELRLETAGLVVADIETLVLGRLRELPRMLVVVDDVDTWSRLEPHLPRSSPHALLVTTRTRGFGGARFQAISLEPLDRGAARRLLEVRLGEAHARSEDEVEGLTAALGHHPLALEVAGAHLGNRPHWSASKFLERMGGGLRAVKKLDEASYLETFDRMMRAVWTDLDDALGSTAILEATGLFGDAPARLDMLESAAQLSEAQDFDDGVAELVGLHLLQRRAEHWSTPQLVRASARSRIDASEQRIARWTGQGERLAACLHELGEYERVEYAQLRPHVDGLVHSGIRNDVIAGVASLAQSFSWRAGQFREAETYARLAVSMGTEIFGAHHPEVATHRVNLGTVLHERHDLLGARREFEAALAIDLETLGAEHPDLAIVRNNLGLVLQDLGELQAARDEVWAALKITTATRGGHHRELAARHHNLGAILRDLGDSEGARRELESALALTIEFDGRDHPRVAARRNGLGLVLHVQGDLEHARDQLQVSVTLTAETLGDGHPDLAVRRNNLGLVLQDLGDLQGARRELEAAVRVTRDCFGEYHPRVADCRSHLGLVLRELGELELARTELAAALHVTVDLVGERDQSVARHRDHLGGVLQDLGELPAARREFETALELSIENLGAGHAHVSLAHNNLGRVLQDLGEVQVARREFEMALKIGRETLGDEHPHVAVFRDNLEAVAQ